MKVLSPGSKGYSPPKIRVEVHLKLCERLLREGEELLAKKDYVQASEKFWGAASQRAGSRQRA